MQKAGFLKTRLYCTAGNRVYEDIIIRLNINSVLACFSSPYVEKEELLFSDSVHHQISYFGFTANRGIKHDFPFINIRKVPRAVLKTRDVAYVVMNDKIMFDWYYCINSTKPAKMKKILVHYTCIV